MAARSGARSRRPATSPFRSRPTGIFSSGPTHGKRMSEQGQEDGQEAGPATGGVGSSWPQSQAGQQPEQRPGRCMSCPPRLAESEEAMNNPFTALRAFFGPTGEHWSPEGLGDGHQLCLVAAAGRLARGTAPSSAWFPAFELWDVMRVVLVTKGIDSNVADWNDDPDTGWPEVEWLLGECEHRWELTHG